MSVVWRWWREETPLDPWTNMARDEAMLADLREGQGDMPIVRLYQWDRPSVSIGRLQSEEDARRLCQGVPFVRRPTGGLAVLHGLDLTITVAALEKHLIFGPISGLNPRRGVLASYHAVVAAVAGGFRACGIETSYGGGDLPRREKAAGCFETAARCDLLDSRTGRKILGCAQRWDRGAVLQQMSLPLDVLPEQAAFERHLKLNFEAALGVEEWRSIDSGGMV